MLVLFPDWLEAVSVITVFVFSSALVVYCTKSRRAERYWQKTLLQMEEMESQIREEIRKGVFTQEHTASDTRPLPLFQLCCYCGLDQKLCFFSIDQLIFSPRTSGYLSVCARLCVCVQAKIEIYFPVWSGREIQQSTDLCPVSMTPRKQRLTNDQQHTDTLSDHIVSVVSNP